MIVGIGTDIVSVARVKKSLDRNGDKFSGRILHSSELLELQTVTKRDQFLAKRFAVKEAASKALGTGFSEGVSWQDIYIEHDELGKPILCFSGKALIRAKSLGVNQQYVTLSDEREYAVAFVVLEN
ncbi:MAG: holo-ACP synthase [Pseudomonadales bacterium]|nr:holo-ACP synthase [Pseudomonadales bacterium]